MNLNTIKCFGEAIAHGDKYIYQTVPRLLTLWLDMGESRKDVLDHRPTKKATAFMAKATGSVPTYKVIDPTFWPAMRLLTNYLSGILPSRRSFLVLAILVQPSGQCCRV